MNPTSKIEKEIEKITLYESEVNVYKIKEDKVVERTKIEIYKEDLLSLISASHKELIEVCICAAVKLPSGYVVRGHRHNDCYRTLQGMERWKNGSIGDVEDGFMTTKNRFVDRKEGLRLQLAAGIKSADREGSYRGDELYSEDLY